MSISAVAPQLHEAHGPIEALPPQERMRAKISFAAHRYSLIRLPHQELVFQLPY